jgi:allantoin racemase
MAHILVVNPNTSTEMTARIEATATAVAGPNTEITAVCPSRGPESLESFYEYHLAAVATLETVAQYRGDVDGVVVACYGDPGLYPLKELLDVPVIGVAEASMATATLLGHRFAILVALDRAVAMMENLVQWYGFADRLASIESTGLSVLELETDATQTMEALTAAGHRAIDRGSAEVFVLGCSGMSGYDTRLTDELGVPVIDPVESAVTTVEGLVAQNLTQSHGGLWATPPTKELRGELPGDEFSGD